MTGHASFESAVEALRLGADDYITKPFDSAFLTAAVKRCIEKQRMRNEIRGLKNLNRMKTEFIYNVTHELLRPLTASRGAIDSIQMILDEKKVKNKDLFSFVEMARNNTSWMGRLIKNLAHFTRLDRGSSNAEMAPVDFSKLIPDIVSEIKRESVKNTGVDIEIKLADNMKPIHADGDKLKIALENLINNALKFTPAGGKITVSARIVEKGAEIRVADTGIGIPPEERNKIFDRFYRGDSSLTHRVGGLGIGLSLVKQAVAAHKGKIRVESAAGKGSEFILSIPDAGKNV